MLRIVRHDVSSFLKSAEDWLLRAEAENNLVLGIASQLKSERHPYVDPIYLSTVEVSGKIVGCAFRTPPFGFGLTRMPADCIPAVVNDANAVFDSLPSVVGPGTSVSLFAREWCRLTGAVSRVVMHQRIYALSRVTQPASPPPGKLRVATSADLSVVEEWASEFVRESGVPANLNQNAAEQLVEECCLHVWEDDTLRSMAAVRGPTPNGIRVGFVYTPPEARRMGYASACVAALSQLQLDNGKRFCFLYTDLANPTSNAIYQRIGYRPVSDSMMCMFERGGR